AATIVSRRAAARVLAYEPAWELEDLDTHGARRLTIVAARRGHEGVVGAQLGEALREARAQARFVEGHATALAPEVQAADEHGVVEQVDHRAGAVGRDHLALAHLAVRRRVLPAAR